MEKTNQVVFYSNLTPVTLRVVVEQKVNRNNCIEIKFVYIMGYPNREQKTARKQSLHNAISFVSDFKRTNINSLLLLLAFIFGASSSCMGKEVKKKPNIVFILVDDLGYGDVGFTGSKYYETPNLDAVAEQSLILDNSYMYPTCSPSRTALFTGKQSYRTGVYTVPVLERKTSEESIFSRWTVGEEHVGYSQPLSDAGYQMVHIGKWHLVGPYPLMELAMDFPIDKRLSQMDGGDLSWAEYHKTDAVAPFYPRGRGYKKNVGGTYRGDPALEKGGYQNPKGGYFAPFSNPFIEPKVTDEWLTDRLTDEAMEFMDKNKEKPFFIDLHYYTVHRPLRARSEELRQKYLNKPGDPITGQGMEKGKKREDQVCYASMIENMDDNIGRIVDYLDQNNLRENTILIFTSDNGQNGRPNKLLRGSKGMVYEGGIRVPTFLNWPGQIEPRNSKTPVLVTDYFPTFMDLAGISYKGTLDGESILPLFKYDDKKLEKRALFWHIASVYKQGACSIIRKDNLKLIQFLADGALELYDLDKDPAESTNLALSNPKLAKSLQQELENWRKTNKVPLPLSSPLQW